MMRGNSPFVNDTSSYTESLRSNDFSMMDEVSSQASNLSRPSAKAVYMQRKEYAASINKILDKFQYRVEHLLTCDLDGKELSGVPDCVERLTLLDGMGRVWGQNMLLAMKGAELVLTDIETKVNLEFNRITGINLIGEFFSALDGLHPGLEEVFTRKTGRVGQQLADLRKQKKSMEPTVNRCYALRGLPILLGDNTSKFFTSQEELESIALSDVVDIQSVLDAGVFNSLLTVTVQSGRRPQNSVFLFQCDDNRADMVEKHLSQVLSRRHEISSISSGSVREEPVLLWTAPDYEDDTTASEVTLQGDEDSYSSRQQTPVPQLNATDDNFATYTELDRNVDILNHILGDVEIFMGKISAILAKNGKKKKKKKKKVDGMPSAEEFAVCLRKIKSGFNLLGELNGKINNPSAPDFVHTLFAALGYVVAHCPEGLPPSILAPVLNPESVHLMREEVSEEEENLWLSLGEAWSITSTPWAETEEDIPIYNLEFFDGWQPPEVNAAFDSPRESMDRQPNHTPSHTTQQWRPPRQKVTKRSGEPQYMLVLYDFNSRNHRELTIAKGETVEVLDTTKQWWKVRNAEGEEGHVPNNVLRSVDEQTDEDIDGPPVLTKRSKPAEVKAWLEDKDFTKITVRCLGVLSGSMLLGMTREELKTLCPEEGGRVFYQLQAVKAALAAGN